MAIATENLPAPAEGTDKYAALIEAERLRAQYNNLPVVVIGTMVAASITAAAFVGTLPPARIAAWLAIMLASALGRWWLVLRPHSRAKACDAAALENPPVALRRILLGALAGGCAWGSAGVLLFAPGSVPLQAWLAIWLAGMGVSSIPAYAAHLRVLMAYLLPSIAPFVVVLLLTGSQLTLSIGLGLILYVAAVVRFARNFHEVLVESLRLRFENLDLVAALQVQKNAAEAANIAKSRFLAAASHDLRQPMHAMSFYIAALANKPLAAEEQKITANLQRCADTMDGMFGALLDVSRLDASIVAPRTYAFALTELLDRVRIEFGPRAAEKGLALKVRATPLIVKTDPQLLARVVGNLVSNAVHYTARGRVLVACRARGASVRIVVGDTGRGIPADKQALVFEEFFQLGNPERDRAKGLGLGLAVVDRLVRLLGWTLTLRSAEGRGAFFMIDVPRASQADAPGEALDAMHDAGAVTIAGALVLAVDDEADVLDATRTLVASWGATVITASSGAEALRRMATCDRPPDVLMFDYRLRDGEDALAVIAQIREEFNCDIPALLITGDTAPDRLRDAQASGLALLHKPVDAARLRRAMTEALRSTPILARN